MGVQRSLIQRWQELVNAHDFDWELRSGRANSLPGFFSEVTWVGLNDGSRINLGGLASFSSLRSLDLSDGQFDLDQLPLLESVKDVEFVGWQLSDDGVHKLARRCPNLTHLVLRDLGISDAALEHIAELEHLESLDVSGNDRIVGKHIETLVTRCKHLRSLTMDNTCVDDAHIGSITGARLEVLSLLNTRLTPTSFDLLSQIESLRLLRVKVDDVSIEVEHRLINALPNCDVIVLRGR